MSKATVTENAQRLNESAMSGIDFNAMTEADYRTIGQIINGYVKNAKNDALNVNPAVLFTKTAKILNEKAGTKRLPDDLADWLKGFCNDIAMNSLAAIQDEGYVISRIGKTQNFVSVAKQAAGTKRNVTMVKSDYTLKSQLYIVNSEIHALERKIEKAKLEYRDTSKHEERLEALMKVHNGMSYKEMCESGTLDKLKADSEELRQRKQAEQSGS